MNKDMKSFIKDFMLNELTTYETKYWVWSIRKRQPTLSCYS